MLLILGIEKYGFGYEFVPKSAKPTQSLPKTNTPTSSQPKNASLSSKLSSWWTSKTQKPISPLDQQIATEFDAITIPNETQTNTQLLEIQRQQNFLKSSATQQKNILNTADPVKQQVMLDAPVQKSSGWSLFSPRLSANNLQKSNSIKSSGSPSTELSDTASISSGDSLDFSEFSQPTTPKSPSPIMDYVQDGYQSFMNKANKAVVNTNSAVTSVKDAITPKPVAPVRAQINYTPEYRPGEKEMLNTEYTTFKNAREQARQQAKAAGKPFSFPDFATFTDQLNQELYTSSTPTVKTSPWSKTTSQNTWEQQHQLYRTN